VIGAGDADIMVSLKPDHHPTAGTSRRCARTAAQFPVTFYFLPADMITQILNFGIPAPIDVQIEGNDVSRATGSRRHLLNQPAPGAGHRRSRIQQPSTIPRFDIAVDRTKAQQGGLSRARCRQQHAGHAERQLPDHADVLPEPAKRRELQPGDAGAAVRRAVAAGSAEHPGYRTCRRSGPKSWPMSPRSLARTRWRRSITTTSAA
jgi:hypothetical protein